MTDGMIVPATTLYFGTAVLLTLATLGFVGLAVRTTGKTRQMLLVGAIPAASMATAYVFMGMGWLTVTTAGREQSVARFIGYTFVLLAFAHVCRHLLEFSRRGFLAVSGLLLLTPWFALASWLTAGLLESALTGLSVVAFLVGAYVLFGPLSDLASTVSGERRLVYAKLRNLFVLCWGALIIQSGISEQSLGLTNLFVGQLGASYTDIIFMVGIGLLVISAKEIFDGDGIPEHASNSERTPQSTQITSED